MSAVVVKNTFLECDAAASTLAMRRVSSEPVKSRRRLSSAVSLVVNTDCNVEGARLTEEASSQRLETQDNELELEQAFWPATPEGNFLPKNKWLAPLEESLSGEETPSTVSESMNLCASWSTCAFEEAQSPVESVSSWSTSRFESSAVVLSTSPPRAQMMPPPSDALAPVAQDEQGGSKTMSIAQVQEMVQSAENTARFKFPPGVKVLQWTYQQTRRGRLPHRAVLSFLCNGVPHYIAGDWQPCKKTARQSAAEVAMTKLQGVACGAEWSVADACIDLSHVQPSAKNFGSSTGASLDHIAKMEANMKRMHTTTSWNCQFDEASGMWHAMMRCQLIGMEHAFIGPALHSEQAARAELSCRVMWLLGVKPCRGLYVVDRRKWLAMSCEVPPAPKQWREALC
mmetsp:Transcript_25265/g.58182  ORF Transcript_25265/g.58182 Transcript_25265/m.58182 type:complete len:399 (-) Transcript_25265:144-1340(-)